MRKDILEDIINRWDPIGLFPDAPDNEYAREINIIYKYIEENEIVKESLAIYIHSVFTQSFGTDLFTDSIEQCMRISERINSGTTG